MPGVIIKSLFLVILLSTVIYVLKSILEIINKIKIYIEKLIKKIFYKNKPLIIVSKDRTKFESFIKVNNLLKIK